MKRDNKSQIAKDLGISRQLIYYQSKQEIKD
jgi:transcriptional regulator with PAS, ATPase and Fis domain